MSELDKLEAFLKLAGCYYKRFDEDSDGYCADRHQIIVYECPDCTEDSRLWDAVCQRGSYGYEEGLLEIMGVIVDEALVGDSVEGFLTWEDVALRSIYWEKEKCTPRKQPIRLL